MSQGVQFTSEAWINALKQACIHISMDAKGRCIDNIYIERFWRTIKYEAIYLNEYDDYQVLYLGVKQYIDCYNHQRPHQSLNYKMPFEVYEKSLNSKLREKVIIQEKNVNEAEEKLSIF